MTINNFDKSSTGVDIELDIFFDSYQSRRDFDDAFHVIQYSSYRETAKFFYTDFGAVEFEGSLLDYYSPPDIGVKALIKKWLEYSGETAREAIDGIKYFTDKSRLRDFTADDVHEYAKERAYSEDGILEWYEVAGYKSRLEKVGVTGYCQGDYAEVYYLPEYAITADFAQKLIYNAPLHCCLTVDGAEYFLGDELADRYGYGQDEVIEAAESLIEHPKKAQVIEWLKENLPVHPDYI